MQLAPVPVYSGESPVESSKAASQAGTEVCSLNDQLSSPQKCFPKLTVAETGCCLIFSHVLRRHFLLVCFESYLLKEVSHVLKVIYGIIWKAGGSRRSNRTGIAFNNKTSILSGPPVNLCFKRCLANEMMLLTGK